MPPRRQSKITSFYRTARSAWRGLQIVAALEGTSPQKLLFHKGVEKVSQLSPQVVSGLAAIAKDPQNQFMAFSMAKMFIEGPGGPSGPGAYLPANIFGTGTGGGFFLRKRMKGYSGKRRYFSKKRPSALQKARRRR